MLLLIIDSANDQGIRMRSPIFRAIATGLCAMALFTSNHTVAETTLERVRDRGELLCGVQGGYGGMSIVSKQGTWQGFDVDFCRAIALAVLEDQDMVDFIALSARVRLPALINEEVDVLIRNTTWVYERDTSMPLDFVGINLYDGQGFIIKKSLSLKSIDDVKPNTNICVKSHTTTESNLVEYNQFKNLRMNIMTFSSKDEAVASFFGNKCDIYTGDASELYSQRNTLALNPEKYVILDDRISKEPLGPVVRDNDPQWTNIVRWVLFATIEAEEKGITSSNIDQMLNSKDPSIRYILGVDPGIGKRLGLDDQWALRVIRVIGNYGEIFDRHFGPESSSPMDRGLNHLWTDGGIMYVPPLH